MAFVGQYRGDPQYIRMLMARAGQPGQTGGGALGASMRTDFSRAQAGMAIPQAAQGLYGQALETGSGLLQDPEAITDAMQQQMISRAQSGIQQQFGERSRQLQRSFAQRGISGAARQRLEQEMGEQRTAALTGAEQDVIRQRAMQRGADIRSGLGAVMPLLQHQYRMESLSGRGGGGGGFGAGGYGYTGQRAPAPGRSPSPFGQFQFQPEQQGGSFFGFGAQPRAQMGRRPGGAFAGMQFGRRPAPEPVRASGGALIG